jgi:hypothetical protein
LAYKSKEEVVEFKKKNPTIFWRAVGTYFSKIWRFQKTNPQNLMTKDTVCCVILCCQKEWELFIQRVEHYNFKMLVYFFVGIA